MSSPDYVNDFLPPGIIEQLEAGAFQSLCTHLRERSDEVQNIDLMTISGFCRNCLAKWMVIEARNLADRLREDGDDAKDLGTILQGLDALGYDEAAEYVYGIGYPEWKKRHSKKASDDQMQRFNDSKPLWAPIHKTALSKRSEANVQPAENASTYMSPPAALRRNYVEAHLPPPIVEKLEAGAFQSLAAHLRERSDEVQNIDLMTISGFCRNCLAKWMVVEARQLAGRLRVDGGDDMEDLSSILQGLDTMGYDEAAQYIYGMEYPKWKKRYSKKASSDQMELLNNSKPLWAAHDKALLATRGGGPSENLRSITCPPGTAQAASNSLLSNVCCEDVEEAVNPEPAKQKLGNRTRELPRFEPPVPPNISFSLGILTVSDRASSGEYETGDLSGPAVKEAVVSALKSYGGPVGLKASEYAIVSDDSEAIQSKLKEWADTSKLDLIFTTGGTGFAARDVTPEATNEVIARSCEGLVTFVTMECAKTQPLSSLSRGTAGVRGNTLIANLPGNPKGVREIIPILLPLVLHAVADIKYI